MVSNNVSHGKERCLWCDGCGTLVLGKRCACGSIPREFEINSPGDIRPCMGEGVDLILGMFERTFGTCEPLRDKMIFLNKVPGEDRTDEIIAHGNVLAILRFDLSSNDYVLEIRQAGAELFDPYAKKNIVTFGSMSGHLKGKSIPGTNVREIIGEFSVGESIILKKGRRSEQGSHWATVRNCARWRKLSRSGISIIGRTSRCHLIRIGIHSSDATRNI